MPPKARRDKKPQLSAAGNRSLGINNLKRERDTERYHGFSKSGKTRSWVVREVRGAASASATNGSSGVVPGAHTPSARAS